MPIERTICPKCRRQLDDSRLIGCTACGICFSEYERSQMQLLAQQQEALATEMVARV
jgi:hypothetical protein